MNQQAYKQIADFEKQTDKYRNCMLGVLNTMLQNASKNMTPEQAQQIAKALKDSKVMEAQEKANKSISDLNNYFDKLK